MELTIKINDVKSYEALLAFLKLLPVEIELKESDQVHWQEFSIQKLAEAYAENEPEYTLSMIKEPNLLYERR